MSRNGASGRTLYRHAIAKTSRRSRPYVDLPSLMSYIDACSGENDGVLLVKSRESETQKNLPTLAESDQERYSAPLSESGVLQIAIDSGIDSNGFSQDNVFGCADENLKNSPTNFASFLNTVEVEKCQMSKKGERTSKISQYRQSSIRDFCHVTSRINSARSGKRVPFGDLTNTCLYESSPKSRLEVFTLRGKRAKRRIFHDPHSKVVTATAVDARNDQKLESSGSKPLRKRSFYIDDQSEAPIAGTSMASTLSSSSPRPLVDRVQCRSVHKRYCTDIAENAFTHLDDSTIPGAARASLHRSQSSSFLETSHNSSISDEPENSYSLKIVKNSDSSAYGYLKAETLHELLVSMCEVDFERKFLLVDCRYPYEFNGGHIKNAHNLYDTRDVERFFYPKNRKAFLAINARIPIFYCEYSQKRGPAMALALRKLDRMRNEDCYPKIDYKEIYVLQFGYKNFYESYHRREEDVFTPKGYVEMTKENHTEDLINYRKSERFNTCCTLYGTETRFHQMSARYDELVSCQLDDDNESLNKVDETDDELPEKHSDRTVDDWDVSYVTTSSGENFGNKPSADDDNDITDFDKAARRRRKSDKPSQAQKSFHLRRLQADTFRRNFKTSNYPLSSLQRSLSDSSALRITTTASQEPQLAVEAQNTDLQMEVNDLDVTSSTSLTANDADMALRHQIRCNFSKMSVHSPISSTKHNEEREDGHSSVVVMSSSPGGNVVDSSPLRLYSRAYLYPHGHSPILEETSSGASSIGEGLDKLPKQ